MTQTLPIAAIVYSTRGAADGPMTELARKLRGRGAQVRGFVQREDHDGPGGARRMLLTDLESGTCFDISQKLGAGAGSGCVDPGVLAGASAVLRRALTEATDLVVVSRFGELEAAAGGFASEMLELMGEGVPLLTAVSTRFLESWRRFTGGCGAELAPDIDALEAWFAALRRAGG